MNKSPCIIPEGSFFGQFFLISLKLLNKNFFKFDPLFDLNLILCSKGFKYFTPIEFFLVNFIFLVTICILAIAFPIA